jgi:hypothetical protein
MAAQSPDENGTAPDCARVQLDSIIHDRVLDNHVLDSQALNDHALNDHTPDDHALDDHVLNDHRLKNRTLDEHALNDHTLDNHAVNNHTFRDHKLDDHILIDYALNDHALINHALNDHVPDDHVLDDHSLDDCAKYARVLLESRESNALDNHALHRHDDTDIATNSYIVQKYNGQVTEPASDSSEDEDYQHIEVLDGEIICLPELVKTSSEFKTVPRMALGEIPVLLPNICSIAPSAMVQREAGLLPEKTDSVELLIEALYRQTFGFSSSYHGDVTNPANWPEHVSAERNCNLWLTDLPSGCTEADLESAVMGMGSIWAMSVSPADLASGHNGAAASIAFTRIGSARKALAVARWQGIRVRGQRARVIWNRNRVGPQEHETSLSRVLVINGPRAVVNQATLSEFFGRYCSYRTTGVEVLDQDACGWATMEWRFARVNGQADIIAVCLRALRDEHGMDVDFEWDIDPCEEVEHLERKPSLKQLIDLASQSSSCTTVDCAS